MTLRALTFAAGLSLTFAGSACSQETPGPVTAPAADGAPAPISVADEGGGFNLDMPGEDDETGAYGGFNLDVPFEPAADGFRLREGPVVADGATSLPDVAAPALDTPGPGEDEIIRLEP